VSRWHATGAGLLLGLVCCGAPAAPDTPVLSPPPMTVGSGVTELPAAVEPPAPEQDPLAREIARSLDRVVRARGLASKAAVRGRMVDRDACIKLIMAKAEKDLPKKVLVAQGDLLAALGLIPPDYDFADGIYGLVQRQVAGFYDPDADTMYILDDVSGAAAQETLDHELVHALQDQHYDLGTLLKYAPGKGDRLTAAHALGEGDATVAMLEASQPGSAAAIPKRALRAMFSIGLTLTEGDTPRVLQGALTAPYVDGFGFVQALRARGGWAAVDAAWQRLPISTEQVLHIDKYVANELPIEVAPLSIAALGEGWTVDDTDVLGEQGLRLVLEQWTRSGRAAEAAEGWGGDRFVVASRTEQGSARWAAMAWHIVFDDEGEAIQAEAVLDGQFGKRCRERPKLGAMAWRRHGARLTLVAGPLPRNGATARPASCSLMNKWLTAIVNEHPAR